MPAETSVQNARIALFIDVENLVGSASTIGLPIDVSPVLEKLKEYGRVQVRRSFGDLEKCLNSVGKGSSHEAVNDTAGKRRKKHVDRRAL
jgi:hypothetical protein